MGDAAGERSGGLIRIAVPRYRMDFRDGDLLRDTGAYSWIDLGTTSPIVDTAPDGTDPVFGSGADYRVGTCA
jgi:hypothetical protein